MQHRSGRMHDATDAYITVKQAACTSAQRRHLLRTCSIALVVGTWLTLFNHGDILLTEGIETTMMVRVALNYMMPFIVANMGLLSRNQSS